MSAAVATLVPHLGDVAGHVVLVEIVGTDEIQVESYERDRSLAARSRLRGNGWRCGPVSPDAPYRFRVRGRTRP